MEKVLTQRVYYKQCGCSATKEYTIDLNNLDGDNFKAFMNDGQGIDGKCPKCMEFDAKYHLIKTVVDGDFDSKTTIYLFDTQNIKEVVRYCWAKDIPLHDEHYRISSMYDCTGLAFATHVKVSRGKKYITVLNTVYYDV